MASYLAAPLGALDRLQHAELTGEDEMMIQQALQRIDVIASVVDIWGWLGEEEGLGIGWISPSLLGMFALMMLSDLKAGHEVRRCPNCETLFLAKNVRAVYCSSTCRHAQQKREWRRAKAAKREVSEDDS